jgi:uncharacterized RDD family membrane protein YckC
MDVNPYQPPVEDAVPQLGADSQFLATRGSRLAAAIVDSLANLVIVLPAMWGLGMFDNLENLDNQSTTDQVVLGAVGLAAWFVINIAFLGEGQTIGKRVVGIRIVDYGTGERIPIARLIFMRYLPTTLVAAIPLVGSLLSLVNILFIFGSEQRCIHDHIAGTKVVQV